MISYQADGIKMPAIKKRETTEWIKAVAASYEKRIGEIAYIFCSDEKILEVNRQYLQHDYYTDIITFDYCEGNRLSPVISLSALIRYAPMPNNLPATIMKENCTGSLSMASCTFAASMIKVRENGKLWKLPRTRHWPCDRNCNARTSIKVMSFLSSLITLTLNYL